MRAECSLFVCLSIACICYCFPRSYLGQGQENGHWRTWFSQVVFQALDLCFLTREDLLFAGSLGYGWPGQGGWLDRIGFGNGTGSRRMSEWVRCRLAPVNAPSIEPHNGLALP